MGDPLVLYFWAGKGLAVIAMFCWAILTRDSLRGKFLGGLAALAGGGIVILLGAVPDYLSHQYMIEAVSFGALVLVAIFIKKWLA